MRTLHISVTEDETVLDQATIQVPDDTLRLEVREFYADMRSLLS